MSQRLREDGGSTSFAFARLIKLENFNIDDHPDKDKAIHIKITPGTPLHSQVLMVQSTIPSRKPSRVARLLMLTGLLAFERSVETSEAKK